MASVTVHILAGSVGLIAGYVALSTFGFEALSSPKSTLNGMPAVPYFIFGLIGLLASAGDFRLMRSGGVQTVRGVLRVRRHLWRMCTA